MLHSIKKFVFAFLALISISINAQAPNKFTYQAVIRDASNHLLVNTNVGFRISILLNSPSGPPQYEEVQNVTTNANGLATLIVGEGTVTLGGFNFMKWENFSYYLKTEIDPMGGNNYTITSTTQLMSVPYALSAANGFSKSVSNANDFRTDHRIGILTDPTTSDNTVKLEVAGKIKTAELQVTSNASNGKILTSDASGNATWQNPVVPNTYWNYSTTNSSLYPNLSGYMGFGSSSLPMYPFHFKNPYAWMALESTDPNSGAQLSIIAAQDKRASIHFNQTWGTTLWGLGVDENDKFYIWRNGTANAVTIDWSNNVGIGSYNPNNRLTVMGDVDFSGKLGLGYTAPTNKLSVNGGADFNGNVGIGVTNPSSPLSFPAAIGNKILLYPGASGFAGLGVYSNEVRLHTDNLNGRVSFGWQDNSGNYIEFGRFHKYNNEALAIQGNLWANGTVYSSDERFKMNIIPITDALTKLQQINGVEYEMNIEAFKEKNFAKGRQMGFLAQNVEKVVPEAVSENEDGYKGVDYARLVPLLLESIKEQQKQIEVLEKRIEVLEGK